MKLAGEKGIKHPNFLSNELLQASDIMFYAESGYQNLSELLAQCAMALGQYNQTGTNDFVINGLLFSQDVLNLTISAGLALSFSGRYYTGSTFAFVASPGELFSVVLPKDITIGIDTNVLGTYNRIDVIEVRPTRIPYDPIPREYRDPFTGIISSAVTNTKLEHGCEIQVLKGDAEQENYVQSNTAGWIKIGEVVVNAGSSSISTLRDTNNSENWLGNIGKVIRVQATSELKYNRVIQRDANGRAKIASPVDSEDIATKGYVDLNSGGGTGILNFLKNNLEINDFTYITNTGCTLTWSTSEDLSINGSANVSVGSSGTGRKIEIELSELSDAQITEMVRLSFYYKLTTGAEDHVQVYILNGTDKYYFDKQFLTVVGNTITKYDAAGMITNRTGNKLVFEFKDNASTVIYLGAALLTPRVIPQSAVISEWQSYTPTFTGFGTVTNINAKWRRVGSNVEIYIKASTGTHTAVSNRITLPNGIIGNETKIQVGSGSTLVSSNAGYVNDAPIIIPDNEPTVIAYSSIGTGSTANSLLPVNGNAIASGNMALSLYVSFPVVGWTSSINLVTEAEEFASNNSSTDANDTTSFVYGPQGSTGIIGVTNLTSARTKRVEFKTDIQTTDLIKIELQAVGSNAWVDLPIRFPSTHVISPHFAYVNAEGGIVWNAVSGNNRQLDIIFLTYPAGVNSYGWGYSAFVGIKWRVRKISNGNMAEAPASGIYESGSNSNGYYVKYVDGTMIQWVNEITSVETTGQTRTFNITWPSPFADTNYATTINFYEGSSGVGNFNTPSTGNKTTTDQQIAMYLSISLSGASRLDAIAIGKWNLSRSVAAPGTPVGASTVFAHYTGSNIAITNGTIMQFNTKVEDTHDAVTTGASWRWTCPVSGRYEISAYFLDGDTFDTGYGRLFINDVASDYYMFVRGSSMVSNSVTIKLRFNTGDFINFKASATDANADFVSIQITRLSA